MDIFDGHYYKSCKWFLELIGLWPYQSQVRRHTCQIIFIAINALLAIPVGIIWVQEWGKNFNVTMENVGALIFTTACCAKYVFMFQSSKRDVGPRRKGEPRQLPPKKDLKLLFTQIAKDWQRIKEDTEQKILLTYTEEGRFLVIFYTVYAFCAWLIWVLLPFAPPTLDILFPLNETRPLLIPFYVNYIIFDQADYHYWVCCYVSFVLFTSFVLFSGVDTIFVISVKHTCGLFAIVCHKLENVINCEKDGDSIDLIENELMVENLRSAVVLHNDTIRCCGLLEDSFNYCFLVLNFMTVVAIALVGVYVSNFYKIQASRTDNFVVRTDGNSIILAVLYIYSEVFKLLQIVSFVVGVIIHLLYLNWVEQQIIDSSQHVFISAYFSKWFGISINARKLIEIIMIRSLTPCRLTGGKITTLSMESFAVLIKTAVSYFTVILSMT